ncbi:ChaB family protein, partial [Francisella tularensis]
ISKSRTNENLESLALEVAWSAVKNKYYKDEQTGKWCQK